MALGIAGVGVVGAVVLWLCVLFAYLLACKDEEGYVWCSNRGLSDEERERLARWGRGDLTPEERERAQKAWERLPREVRGVQKRYTHRQEEPMLPTALVLGGGALLVWAGRQAEGRAVLWRILRVAAPVIAVLLWLHQIVPPGAIVAD